MSNSHNKLNSRFKNDQGYLLPTALSLIFFSVFVLTWYSIDQSRKESFKLLQIQGKAFTEALAQASKSSIESESIYDVLLHKRFKEFVLSIESNRSLLTKEYLAGLINDHNLLNIIIYERSGDSLRMIMNGVETFRVPVSVYEEIQDIFDFPESSYLLLLEQSENLTEASHYYINISYDLKRVYLIVSDALYFVEALKKSQFGYLAQNIARETGVEYIIYQSPEGIIFASRKPGELLAIESDPFLLDALESDTIVNRITEFQGNEVLELVRPFATTEFPFGLYRVGMSLDSYNSLMRRYNWQIISISSIIFFLVLLIFLFSYNRSRRKEISRELSEVKSVSDKLFNEINSGLAVIDRNGIITMSNKSMEKILGQSNIDGKRWSEIIPSGDSVLSSLNIDISGAVENETTNIFGNIEKTILVSSTKHQLENSDEESLVVVIYDISRIKELEKKALRKERLSELGTLSAGVAHEIRNPLNTISIAAQRLSSEFKVEANQEEYKQFTQQIHEETKRLNKIVTKFLSFARDEETEREEVNLSKLLNDCITFFKTESDSLDITLNIEIEDLLVINSNSDKLKQVFLNLFNNARDALDGKPGTISIMALKNDDRVEIFIEDSGSGININIREKVFTPFFTTKESGTGLGLPTVNKILNDYGAEIKIIDGKLKLGGACFKIILPG